MINVFVAGHQGMVGSAIVNSLREKGNYNIVARARAALDLTNQEAVSNFFATEQIDEVYICAARVGGIRANSKYPADFIYENLMIETNVINSAYRAGVQKLCFLGSSCIYPKFAPQPIKEEELLNGYLEATNEPYAIAKIAGIKLCESYSRQYGVDFRSFMPTNLYGENDSFHLDNAHVIPALMRRFHDAKIANDEQVTVWGTGSPRREFMHVRDLAAACVKLMEIKKDDYKLITRDKISHINIGTGIDHTIYDVAHFVKDVVGFKGQLIFDSAMPNGTPRKILDITRLNSLGFKSQITLEEGLSSTYRWFLSNINVIRR